MGSAAAGPLFDTSTPISFFTNVASHLLSSQLQVDLSHIEVYPTNQYTPSVHRLLQVTANILDAENTNFYPSVFRPMFSKDASNDIFITGYQPVTSVSGLTDPQLATPYNVVDLLKLDNDSGPLADSNGPVNVYGVPWVIGAKQGLPNFNQLYLVNATQVTRNLEVTRTSANLQAAQYGTNQMYIIGISNNLGVFFWNSYNSNYPHPVTVFATDTLCTLLTNNRYAWFQVTNFTTSESVTSWPGSQWVGKYNRATPNSSASFLPFNWSAIFQNPTPYNFNSGRFDPIGQWQTTTPPLPQLPKFGLSLTNYLQAFILDGSNVIDYVQLNSPACAGVLNDALADPDYPYPDATHYQWSTNTVPGSNAPTFGVMNQLFVSTHPQSAPSVGGLWTTAPTPMGISTPDADAAYFSGFFTPTFQYNGETYVNHLLVQYAPYTPVRTVFTSFLLQVNDPLVHYLASDLNGLVNSQAIWSGKQLWKNGIWSKIDDLRSEPLPTPPLSPIGGRYQPWGYDGSLMTVLLLNTNTLNPACRDPLVWGSDYWNFPTGQTWSVSWLGQVHRGTPWQTIFLKSTNVLDYQIPIGAHEINTGSATWAFWTGDMATDSETGLYTDAANSAPILDWQLVSLLAGWLNTNDLQAQFSVNNSDPNVWETRLDGMTALTNSAQVGTYNTLTISSNSPQAIFIANAIESARNAKPDHLFHEIGDVLATPQLALQSPYLNPTAPFQFEFGINDQAYEVIPSQLLPLLRVDSIGSLVATNGQTHAVFSGYDGHDYAVQTSSDLLHWKSVSTNSPINGTFDTIGTTTGDNAPLFYRTLLIQ